MRWQLPAGASTRVRIASSVGPGRALGPRGGHATPPHLAGRASLLRVQIPGSGLPAGLGADPEGRRVLVQLWQGEESVTGARRCGPAGALLVALEVRGKDEEAGMSAARAALGDPGEWGCASSKRRRQPLPARGGRTTWQCEPRCRYCTIPKQGGRVMTPAVLDQSLDLLLSADLDRYALHFGGEPFLEWDLIQHAVRAGESRAPGRIQYRFTTNGWALTPSACGGWRTSMCTCNSAWMGTQQPRTAPVGPSSAGRIRTPTVQRTSRTWSTISTSRMTSSRSSIRRMPPWRTRTSPTSVTSATDASNSTMRWALGGVRRRARFFASALHRLGHDLRRRWAEGESVEMVNLNETRMRVRTNREVTVDWDGTVMSSNGFLYVPAQRDHYVMGHLDDGHCFDRYVMDGPSDADSSWWYPEDVTQNNQGWARS